MIDDLLLFRGSDYIINEHIKISQPTLDDICVYGEQKYYNMVTTLCATPSDYKVQLLDKYDIDYETMPDFKFFSMLYRDFPKEDTAILFGNLDLQRFKRAQSRENGELVLVNDADGIVIDNTIYILLVSYLRRIHNFQKNVSIGGNEHTKNYLLEKERRRLERQKNQRYQSMLVPLISAMINCEQFKYNYDTIWNLPICVFMDSIKRIQKLKHYNEVMQGVYTGNVTFKSLSRESLNWMGSFDES